MKQIKKTPAQKIEKSNSKGAPTADYSDLCQQIGDLIWGTSSSVKDHMSIIEGVATLLTVYRDKITQDLEEKIKTLKLELDHINNT